MTNTSQNTSRNKLTRQQLELINRRTIQYPTPVAEKDYFLALAIQLVHMSPSFTSRGNPLPPVKSDSL
ncbi:MAG: hypothetical protein MUO76_11795 [Anaerolineaceae bacterium]|nr:hypothetical protein [Anaerolineaceae bacterium]